MDHALLPIAQRIRQPAVDQANDFRLARNAQIRGERAQHCARLRQQRVRQSFADAATARDMLVDEDSDGAHAC